MREADIYRDVLWAWFALSAVTFVALFVTSAPYGKHQRRGWGPTISPRWGWLLMEAPAAIVIAIFGLPLHSPRGWLLFALWELHYVQRGFVYPFRLKSTRAMPLTVVAMAIFFNGVNGWLNGRGLAMLAPFSLARLLVGVTMFVVGLAINWDADRRLFAMPRGVNGDYSIPHGGLFELVTSPNYFGELVEWLGFAIACGSLASWSFFAWTFANLAPRALAHHRWYKKTFTDYPHERRALVPYLW